MDQPEFCDFFTPALVARAPVAIAIGTEGAGPVLAQMIRARIDQMLSPSLGKLARLAVQYRDAAEQNVPKGALRRNFWRRFFSVLSQMPSLSAIHHPPAMPLTVCCNRPSAAKAASGLWALVPVLKIC